jgi:hypothetical protein
MNTLIAAFALAVAPAAAGQEQGVWNGDPTASSDGVMRLGFEYPGEGHYALFMTCQVGSGWVSVTQYERRRPGGSMDIQAGTVALRPPTRNGPDGVLGEWTETMLPASHPVFQEMSRGTTLTVNGVAYPVRSFAEQRKIAAYSLACDEREI